MMKIKMEEILVAGAVGANNIYLSPLLLLVQITQKINQYPSFLRKKHVGRSYNFSNISRSQFILGSKLGVFQSHEREIR